MTSTTTRSGTAVPQPDGAWQLEVPLLRGKPPLTANQRLHWRANAERVAGVRSVVAWRARQARIEPQEHITVRLHFATGDRRRRDASNLWPTQKAAVDGLRDADVVRDDDGRYVTEWTPQLHTGPGPRRMWLEVWV